VIYVEWLRARKRLGIFAIVLAVLDALFILAFDFGHFHTGVNGRGLGYFYIGSGAISPSDLLARNVVHDYLQRSTIPLDPFLMGASIIAFIFTISLYTSLYAQRESLHVAFTKPLSRTRLALEFFSVDLTSIAALYAYVTLLGLLVIASFGALNRLVAPNPGAVIPIAGILLLYGWMQASTAGLRRGAGGVIAALWVAFLAVPSLMNTPIAQVNAVAHRLWLLDPLRYLGTTGDHHGVYTMGSNAATPQGMPSMWVSGSYELTLLAGFGLGIAGCAIAIINWNRVEV